MLSSFEIVIILQVIKLPKAYKKSLQSKKNSDIINLVIVNRLKSEPGVTLNFCVLNIFKGGYGVSKSEEYELQAEKLILPIINDNNFELVDIEYVKEGGGKILRAYIDKPGGITIDDCELINRAFSDILDENDFIEESYILEVSSPGLGRQLKKPRDFERSIGEDVDIKLYKSIEFMERGKKFSAKEFTGRLDGYDGDNITVFLGEETKSIPCKDISMIRLSIDF